LGGYAAARFGFSETSSEEAFKLLLGAAPGHNQTVQALVETCFDDQGRFREGGIADACAFPFEELMSDNFRDAGMNDGVQKIELCPVSEDNGAEFGAVHAARGIENRRAKFANDVCIRRLAWLNQFVRKGIRIEDGEAEIAEHDGDGALAAGDSTGEAEFEHERLF
jgi:hypothetical protein